MGFDNAVSGWRVAQSIGLCVVLVVGAFGVAAAGAATGSGPQAEAGESGSLQDDGAATLQDDGEDGESNATTQGANNTTVETNNTTDVEITALDAMTAAENETNGTAVGAQLGREEDVNITDLERPGRVYQVDVLLENGTHVVADVNSTDGTIQQVQQQDEETSLLDDVFGDDQRLPEDRPDPSEIRSGTEAVELVRNETGENGTVTAVRLTTEGDRLQYVVETVSGEGIQSTVVVAADPEEGDVLTTEPDAGE